MKLLQIRQSYKRLSVSSDSYCTHLTKTRNSCPITRYYKDKLSSLNDSYSNPFECKSLYQNVPPPLNFQHPLILVTTHNTTPYTNHSASSSEKSRTNIFITLPFCGPLYIHPYISEALKYLIQFQHAHALNHRHRT